MLTVDRLSYGYNTPLLKEVSFSLARGEIVSLLGVSGAGKSTLFRLITKLLKPHGGVITLGGEVTYMMQEDHLLPWRSVLENIRLPLELSKKKGDGEIHSLIHEMGLEGKEDLYPHQLSMGMRQRVSLARALSLKRPILLLDEPFASLDMKRKEEFYKLLKKRDDLTILLITHDFHDALALSNRMLVLKEGVIQGEFKDLHCIPDLKSQVHLML
ncbi:ABC transporter ATP-binding protein [Chlamydiales bacterium]|nr:ABC transporter ATP-binding protein [Chlamydiales bacterium]